LISGGMTIDTRQSCEGHDAARKIQIGAELFEEIRAEEKVDLEFFFSGDDEAHLFVRHDRDRNILDDDVADRQALEQSELDFYRFAEKSEKCSFEMSDAFDRHFGGEPLRHDREHGARIDDGVDGAASVEAD